MSYKSLSMKVSVYQEGNNPIFGEGVTHVSLDDEGGGAFILLEQEDRQLRLDLEELEVVADVARKLISATREADGG